MYLNRRTDAFISQGLFKMEQFTAAQTYVYMFLRNLEWETLCLRLHYMVTPQCTRMICRIFKRLF